MEFIFDEVTPLTDEQWERIISWHRKRCGREVVQGLLAAREFSASMEKLQSMAGYSQEQIDEMSQNIQAMQAAGLPPGVPGTPVLPGQVYPPPAPAPGQPAGAQPGQAPPQGGKQ